MPLFAGLTDEELERIGSVFKPRRFPQGETVIKQGSGAAAFFVIDSGEATVLVDGREMRTLKAGDHFGEMALIDAGTRTASVTAATDLDCSGVTFWDFQPARRGERRDRLEAAAVADRDLPLRASRRGRAGESGPCRDPRAPCSTRGSARGREDRTDALAGELGLASAMPHTGELVSGRHPAHKRPAARVPGLTIGAVRVKLVDT